MVAVTIPRPIRWRTAPVRRRMLALIRLWQRRLRERRALAAMDDRGLRDVGLTRYDAHYEASKPFWRA
jgi:uncharacterized protein YjiS (DUF1127 family)